MNLLSTLKMWLDLLLLTVNLLMVACQPHLVLIKHVIHQSVFKADIVVFEPEIFFTMNGSLFHQCFMLSLLTMAHAKNRFVNTLVRLPWVIYFVHCLCLDIQRWLKFMQTEYEPQIEDINFFCFPLICAFLLAFAASLQLILVPFVCDAAHLVLCCFVAKECLRMQSQNDDEENVDDFEQPGYGDAGYNAQESEDENVHEEPRPFTRKLNRNAQECQYY